MGIEKLCRSLYREMEKGDLDKFISILLKGLEEAKTSKLNMVKTPILNIIGRKLGEMVLEKEWKYDRLYRLWKKSFKNILLTNIVSNKYIYN